MKKCFTFLVLILLFISISGLNAQHGEGYEPIIPLQQNRSVLFGKDIVINDQPAQNQKIVKLTHAFNGWLYAAITYKTSTTDAYISVLKSVDNGSTWTVVLDSFWPSGGIDVKFPSVDIMMIGNTVSDLKFILALVVTNSATLIGYGMVDVYNAQNGAYVKTLCEDSFCYDISVASGPNSIGVLYSRYTNGADTIAFRSSSNGGISLDGYQVVFSSVNRLHRVDLAYGKSLSYNTGQYFAVWEEQDDFGSMPGHIYTSHSSPDFNSPFTAPVNLDGLDAADFNMCMNPAIACQYNNVDNDSSDLSEIVLFEKYNESNQRYDIRAYYNIQAANHTKFNKMDFSDSLHNNLQPDINFNPYDSTFMVTYYDSTAQKLPFLLNNFNLKTPNSWNIVSPGYNDNSELSSPHPNVETTSNLQTGAMVWIGGVNGSNGVAMFDSPSSTWTGISEINKTTEVRLIGAYPNPCSTEIQIAFEIMKTGKVSISLFSILGQPLEIITDQSYSEGRNTVKYNLSYLPEGTYIYNFKSGDFTASGKFTVIR